MDSVDTIVIGGGTAGLTVAAGMAALGVSVALVEKEHMGGDCLNWGCVPTKALIRSAAVAQQVRDARPYGIDAELRAVLLPAIMARVAAVKEEVGARDSVERFASLGVQVLLGSADIRTADTVTVDDRTLRTRRIVVATGSRPSMPAVPGLAEAEPWTNVESLQMLAVPTSLVILGGGPIGLEFAQILSRLGSQVTVVEMAPEVLPREDPEPAAVVRTALEREGVRFLLSARVIEVQGRAPACTVWVEQDGQELSVTAERIMAATGRRPNVEIPGLANLGVQMTPRGLGVDTYFRTAVPHVWAAGDVAGGLQFTHVAAAQAKLVVRNALFPVKSRLRTHAIPWTTYTDPELARVGWTEAEARARYGSVFVYRFPFSAVDRAIIDGRTEGHVKIITDARGRLLGAHVVGADAGNLLQEVVVALNAGIPVGRLAQVIHPYPSRTEGVLKAAEEYWRQRLFTEGGVSSLLRWWAQRSRW